MSTYKIVHVNEKFEELLVLYPKSINELFSDELGEYESIQTSVIFTPTQQYFHDILDFISKRDDYSYYHGVHTLDNKLIKQKFTLQVFEYYILVTESEDTQYIFNIFNQFSQNFYLINT